MFEMSCVLFPVTEQRDMKSTVQPSGVLAMASRIELGPASARVVTVVSKQRSSRPSTWGRHLLRQVVRCRSRSGSRQGR